MAVLEPFGQCKNPSVKKCLNCPKPECDCVSSLHMKEDELEAVRAVGMAGQDSIPLRYKRARKALGID